MAHPLKRNSPQDTLSLVEEAENVKFRVLWAVPSVGIEETLNLNLKYRAPLGMAE